MNIINGFSNDLFLYKATGVLGWFEVWYINFTDYMVWHLEYKAQTQNVDSELLNLPNNPEYETEGESVCYTSIEELMDSFDGEIRGLIEQKRNG